MVLATQAAMVLATQAAMVWAKRGRTPGTWFLVSLFLVSLRGVHAARLSYRVIGSDVTRAGENTSLGCQPRQSGGEPVDLPFFNWYKDGFTIPSQTGSVLRLYNVTKEDEAYYQCGGPGVFTNETGRYLHVFASGDVLPLPSMYSSEWPVEGRPVFLTCHFRHYVVNDKTEFTWYKDSTEVKGQTGQKLQFPPLTAADEGKYTCTAREGPVSSTSLPSLGFNLVLFVSPNVTIETPSPDHVVKGILGQELTLTCKVIRAVPRVPADGYSWSYLPYAQELLRPLVGKTSTLTLGPLTREDRGQYFCQARNDQDLEHLNLTGHASVTLDVVYLEAFSLTPDLEVSEGDLVTLTCRVDSHPPAKLTWTVDGQEVRQLTYNVDHYVIMSAACSDSNNYTCAASNTEMPGLERTATMQLHVICNPASHTTLSPRATTRLPPEQPDAKSGPWTMVAIVPTAILGIILVAAAVLVLLWRRLTKSQRRNRLAKVFNYLCPPQDDGTESRSSTDGQTVVDMELQEATFSDELSRLLGDDQGSAQPSASGDGTVLRRRSGKEEPTAAGQARSQSRQALMSAMRGKIPTPQGQKVNFDDAYKKGTLHVLPPLPDSNTQQPARLEGGPAVSEEEDLEKMESKDIVVQRLYQLLSETVRPDDPPVFLFTQSLPCHTHAIIYHKVYGAIIVKVNTLESVDAASRSLLKQAARDLQDARWRVEEELQGQLHPDGVTLLLALPNLEDNENLDDQDKAWLQKRDVQILAGKTLDKYRAWLQTLSSTERPEPWGLGGDSNHAFRIAVSRYLSMRSYGDRGDPRNWLGTPEQAPVLHSTDKLVHVWGPPGSGKTLLLVDRVRRWLLRGKIVVLAVCGTPYEQLLRRLRRMVVSRMSSDMASKVTFCTNVKQLKKTTESFGKDKNPSSFCVAVDAIEDQFLSALLEACRSSALDSAWTTSRADFPQAEEFEKLGGRRVRLPHTLRCSGPVLQLANTLLPSEANTAACLEFPRASASLPSSLVSIQRHADHLPAAPANFHCGKCDKWLTGVLPSQENSVALDPEQWKHWVVLLTGDWGSESKQLTDKLVDWLTRQGVPAVHEWQADPHVSNFGVSSLRSSDGGSHDKENRAAAQARVKASEDKAGRPAVHVMRSSLFRGLEKRCVLVVHYDWRDDHDDNQSHEKRGSRLSQHRYQLFRAATRCRTTLAVLLLSPSPAASLLPHTNG